ncbi:MAG: hypothetical protein ACLQIB_24315 [Isosphaeraceae bacterium]
MSRLRSSRGSSASSSGASATRSAAASRSGAGRVLVQAPKSDIYTVMLGIALGALVIGCLLMTLILNNYGFSTKVSSVTVNDQVARLA